MCTRTVRTKALAALAVAALAGGCSGGPSSPAAPVQQGSLAQSGFASSPAQEPLVYSIALPSIQRLFHVQPESIGPTRVHPGSNAGNKWIYTAQLYGHDASVYQQNGIALTYDETLTNGLSEPLGTVATVNGWWYVANGGHSNVLIYRSTNNGPVGPTNTLDDAGEIPDNVAVLPNRRLVAVSNLATVSSGPGSVSIYLDRSAEPARTLTYGSDVVRGAGVAIDHRGNCYWSFNDPTVGSGSIVQFAGCSGSGTRVISGITNAGGLVFDQRDDLYYVDQTVGIYKCAGTAQCTKFATGFGDPVNINFDLKQKDLWVADASGYIDALNPKNGQIEYTTQAQGGPTDPPFGIAAAPGGG